MSWQSRVINGLLKAAGGSKGLDRAEVVQAQVEKHRQKPPRSAPMAFFVRGLDVTPGPSYRLKPKGSAPSRHVFYLHGGAYINEISPLHYRWLRTVALRAAVEIHVPIYTLAPHATADVTVPAMADQLEKLIAEVGAQNVTLMGDSAGGGMALAVAQALRGTQPRDIVLIAPWLDASHSDPRQEAIVPFDLMLGIQGLIECGRQYAGALDLQDPLVSPLFGSVEGLAPITIYSGTHDLLNVDAHRLLELCEKTGTPCVLHEGHKMQHVYPVLPLLREGKDATRAITAALR